MKNILILDCGPSLIDVPQEFGCVPDWIIKILVGTGCSFKCIKSYKGETIDHVEGDGWIITGSPRSVYEEMGWMLDLEEKIRNADHYNIPILGICFGHHLIAKSFEGHVTLNPNGWELGAYPIKLTERGVKSRILSGVFDNAIVYQSHRDCVTHLPRGADELAQNKKGTQGFKIHNNIYGVQFHPEFSWDIIKKYVSVRIAAGLISDDYSVPESNAGQVVLHNFIELIL